MKIGYPNRQRQLQKLVERLGLSEQDAINWQLLDLALTHPSISTEANYEQLEFVGDAVVRLAASEFLWETYPNQSVGEFSAIRSVLVSDRFLAEIAESYGMGRYLLIGGSAAQDRMGEQSRLADCLEAVLAAFYLSTQNLQLIHPWLEPHFQKGAAQIRRDPARQNYKAALQEWTQSHYKVLPEYTVIESGPMGDEERYAAQVWFQGQAVGQGRGRSIKAAEQAAARVAYQALVISPENKNQD